MKELNHRDALREEQSRHDWTRRIILHLSYVQRSGQGRQAIFRMHSVIRLFSSRTLQRSMLFKRVCCASPCFPLCVPREMLHQHQRKVPTTPLEQKQRKSIHVLQSRKDRCQSVCHLRRCSDQYLNRYEETGALPALPMGSPS